MPAVIAENDVSIWSDQTGVIYHFPKRYSRILLPGVRVVYYKGKLVDKSFSSKRLSPAPHYFGEATIGKVYPDPGSEKGDLFALIDGYKPFEAPVLAKNGSDYLEPIPVSQASNYWRNGVRQIEQSTLESILSQAKLPTPEALVQTDPRVLNSSEEFVSRVEGSRTLYFGVRYERDPKLRTQAIAIHGLACKACGFDFGKTYGPYAAGYIHVHHTQPISDFEGQKLVNPESDLIPLCANCHSVVHRKRDVTLSVEELKAMLQAQTR